MKFIIFKYNIKYYEIYFLLIELNLLFEEYKLLY